MLWMPSGYKRVEEFAVGDMIYSRDEWNADAPVEVKIVEEVFVRYAGILALHAGGQVVRTTGEHPFFTKDRGWTACNRLSVGDLIRTEDGWVAVEEVWDTGDWEVVYNVRVADHHTYFVGDEGWGWAHNTCFDIGLYASLPSNVEFPRHHVPQVRAGNYTWGNDFDANEAPAIIIPLWMHQQIDHLTGLEFEQNQNADIVVHIRYHLRQLAEMRVPRSKVSELKRLIEATLDVNIGNLSF
jgi:hypothetical protein